MKVRHILVFNPIIVDGNVRSCTMAARVSCIDTVTFHSKRFPIYCSKYKTVINSTIVPVKTLQIGLDVQTYICMKSRSWVSI